MKRATVFLGEMTNPEVEDFLKTRHTVIVPTGATEQHGPHAPLLTDVLIPQEVARRVAPEIGALVAPPINYALSYPHVGFTGLVHIRIPTFMSLIEDLCVAFAASGFKRIIFLNGHYDNTYAIAYACANAAEKLAKDVKAFPVNYWDGLTAEEVARVLGTEERPARQCRRNLRHPGDRSAPRRSRARERGVPAVSRVHREHRARPHGVLLHVARVGVLGDEIGDLGRRAKVDARNRRAVHPGRRPIDVERPRQHRTDFRGHAAEVSGAPGQRSASSQYFTDLAISVIRSDPGGIGYSNSIVAWIGHWRSRSRRSTSLTGVSPSPNGTFAPLLPCDP